MWQQLCDRIAHPPFRGAPFWLVLACFGWFFGGLAAMTTKAHQFWHGLARFGAVGAVWHRLAWFGAVGANWHGLAWFGMVFWRRPSVPRGMLDGPSRSVFDLNFLPR
ncbi:MAG TPA: hypothetical protein VK797_26280 [Tepidisphaeraceae bacterium]|nr:hypothetical protein [Tepidisphaeraceae bacterium]